MPDGPIVSPSHTTIPGCRSVVARRVPTYWGQDNRFATLELTEDKAEGHAAWREKRKPVFRGR